MSAWTIDCWCTTTSMRSYGTPNRWWASIASKPLFIRVAESIVIRPPMRQVGCASASSTETPARSVRPRNGPPEAVRTRRSTVPGGSLPISWNRAECSESTGSRRAPEASASAVVSSPPITRLSLLARATSIPSLRATIVGPRPLAPTIPLRTRSAHDSAISSRIASSPSREASTARKTPWRRCCSASAASFEPAASTTTSSSPADLATLSSAWVPIEPMLPSMRIFFIAQEDRDAQDRAPHPMRSVDELYGQVVADHDGEENRVEAVEGAAVGPEDPPRVLPAQVALQRRLEEVADRRDRGDRGADRKRVDAR